MGREVKRVAMDFAFPVGESWHDHQWDLHVDTCTADDEEHDDCWNGMGQPPAGEGWQLWQTVSDGPISPVFATPDELIDWMCQPVPLKDRRHYAPEAFPDNPWAQGWRREIADPFVRKCGWAPSMVIDNGRAMSGAEAMVELDKAKEKP